MLNLDDRLSPEHPHPAPVEDAVTAFRWLRNQGFDAGHIAIAGDSAGGGLTLATLLSLRDQGLGQPAAAAPISPWADMEGLGGTMTSNADADILVSSEMLALMAGLFLADGDPKDPLAAEKAQEAGVDVRTEVFPEMQHVFQFGAGRLPEADDAVAKIGAFLRPHLGLG